MPTQLLKAEKHVQHSNDARGFTVSDAISLLAPASVSGTRYGVIAGITCDSRDVVPGACFVAVAGEKTDGHRYIPQAAARGATLFVAAHHVELPTDVATVAVVEDTRKTAAILASAFYGHPSEQLDLIGITGTHGKTTTAYMLRHIAQFAGLKAGMLTTVQYDTGARRVGARRTTPDAIRLNQLLREAVDAGVEVMPMEVSSHGLCQHRVTGLKFRGAVFTNLSSDHLDYHKTHEAYREAKAALFEGVEGPDAFCAVNVDDLNWTYYAGRTRAHVVTFSTWRIAHVKGRISSADVESVKFDLVYRRFRCPVSLLLLGVHNMENALGAATCALELGISVQDIAAALNTFPGVPGRLERIETGRGFSVFVDFAHTDGSLATMLANVKPFVSGKLIVVFGAGGDRDKGKRPRMARAAATYADIPVLTSDNPRTEDPMKIIAEVEAGFQAGERHLVVPDRREAIEVALALAGPGDVVVIAGKGHENYQIFSDRTEHFDDCEVVREALRS